MKWHERKWKYNALHATSDSGRYNLHWLGTDTRNFERFGIQWRVDDRTLTHWSSQWFRNEDEAVQFIEECEMNNQEEFERRRVK